MRKMLTLCKMHHPKAPLYIQPVFCQKTGYTYVKRREGGRELVQIEVAYKTEIINIAEYLNTNYKEDQFVNIVKSHESTQPNMNSIIKMAAKTTEELSQPNEKTDAQQDRIQHIKRKIGSVPKQKMEKQSNAQAVHQKYRQTAYQ